MKNRHNLLSSTRPMGVPERELWVAVIFQAIRDASKLEELEYKASVEGDELDPTLKTELLASRRAMNWLSKPSRDLEMVCHLAGISMHSLLAKRDYYLATAYSLN